MNRVYKINLYNIYDSVGQDWTYSMDLRMQLSDYFMPNNNPIQAPLTSVYQNPKILEVSSQSVLYIFSHTYSQNSCYGYLKWNVAFRLLFSY